MAKQEAKQAEEPILEKGADALFDEKATETIESAPLDIESLGGDLRDLMLELFKHRPKPWSAMAQDEQRGIARALKSAVDDALAEIARLIAAEDRHFILARLEKLTAKGGKYQASLVAQGEADLAMEFARLDGHAVLIISADAERYQASRGDAATDLDQPPLEFGEEALPPSAESEEQYRAAVAKVASTQDASTSALQRNARLGYNAAAAFIERMEGEGIVSPADAAGKRSVLVDEEGQPKPEEVAGD